MILSNLNSVCSRKYQSTRVFKMVLYNGKYIVIESKNETYNNRFATTSINFTFRIKDSSENGITENNEMQITGGHRVNENEPGVHSYSENNYISKKTERDKIKYIVKSDSEGVPEVKSNYSKAKTVLDKEQDIDMSERSTDSNYTEFNDLESFDNTDESEFDFEMYSGDNLKVRDNCDIQSIDKKCFYNVMEDISARSNYDEIKNNTDDTKNDYDNYTSETKDKSNENYNKNPGADEVYELMNVDYIDVKDDGNKNESCDESERFDTISVNYDDEMDEEKNHTINLDVEDIDSIEENETYDLMNVNYDDDDDDVDNNEKKNDENSERSELNEVYELLDVIHDNDLNEEKQDVINLDGGNMNSLDWIENSFQEMLDWITKKFPTNYLIGMRIAVIDSASSKPIGISYRPINSLSAIMISDVLNSVIQSNDLFDIKSRIEVNSTIIALQSGGGIVPLKILNEDNIHKYKSRCIISSKNEFNDLLCLPRALILGKAFADNSSDSNMRKYVRKDSVILESGISLLMRKAKINICERAHTGCDMNDIYKLSRVLSQYEIIIYDDLNNYKSVLFRSAKASKKIFIFFMKEKKHFITIRNDRMFFGYEKQCPYCEDFMKDLKNHKCELECKFCKRVPVCEYVTEMIECEDCNRTFRGTKCFNKHKELYEDVNTYTTSTCEQLSVCPECFKMIKKTNEGYVHKCSDKMCSVCNEMVPADHTCFIQKYKAKTPSKFVLIFYDIEARQETERMKSDGSIEYLHEANLLACSQVCLSFLIYFSAYISQTKMISYLHYIHFYFYFSLFSLGLPSLLFRNRARLRLQKLSNT